MKRIKNPTLRDNLQSKKTEILYKPSDDTVRTSPLDLLQKLGEYFTLDEDGRDGLLQKLFPRTVKDSVIIAKNGHRITQDAAIKTSMYEDDLPIEMMPFFSHSFIGWQACALLAQNPYIKKACEIPARDAVAVDYKLHYAHPDTDKNDKTDDKEEQELLNELKEKSDKKYKIKTIARDSNIYKKMFGQILAIPTFSTDMSQQMAKPYTPTAIKPDTYTGMTLVQPFWVTYQLSGDGVSRPNKAGYYEPEYYIINGSIKIHKSWVVKLVNGALADILKPVYYYGGVPLTQQIYERVFCAEKVANEAPKLALTKRLLIIDGNINNLSANPSLAYKTLSDILNVRDNMGVMIKNPGDQVNQIDTSLADFDALVMSQFQLVAAIAEMPVTKLMKTQLKGLANTGDYEMKDYAQSLVEIQENDFNAILEKHYEYLCLSEYGKDLHLVINWNPIDTPSELDVAQIEQAQAATDSQYIQAGVIDASEVRGALRANEDSRFHNLPDEMPEMKLDEMNELLGDNDDEI